MNKAIKLLPAALCLIALSCAALPAAYSDIDVSSPKNTAIPADETKKNLQSALAIKKDSPHILEITIYDFSLLKERLIYDNSGIVSERDETGYIRFLCTVKKEGRIIKAVFLEVRGSNKEEMIEALTREVKKNLYRRQ
ncbi:MAG: hypothetical protein LBT84_00240 [Spirochaetia bacterium]|jgi:hypothetical protein|nr:hypothetical protein [Spirochaetia bacterium]